MTGSVAIDVALGLSFIFLLYSLLATIIQEMVVRWLGLRPRMLLKAVARMLDDEEEIKDKNGNEKTKLGKYIVEQKRNLNAFLKDAYHSRPLTKIFYDHPTIKYLGESSWSSKPSYLNASTFSQVLIDILRDPGGQNNYDGTEDQMDLVRKTLNSDSPFKDSKSTLRQLKIFSAEAKSDILKFKVLVEQWYNETMDRCTGWFKKQTQLMLLTFGLAIAVTFNVDTIGIVKILSSDKSTRQQLVDLATSSYKQFDPQKIDSASDDEKEKVYAEVRKAMDASGSIIGFGWDNHCFRNLYQPSVASMIVGWIITAFAISLGAPFWFDLLNKIMMLRATRKSEAPSVEVSKVTTSPENRIG